MEDEAAVSWAMPFIFHLAAENSAGAVRRTCPLSVLLKAFLVPWPGGAGWMCLCHTVCSDLWCSTRQRSLPLLFLCFSHPGSTCMCSPHPWRKVPVGPWEEPRSQSTGRLCSALLWWHVAHHCCVCCFCLSDSLSVSSLACLSVCCVLSNGNRRRAGPRGALY